MIKDDKFERAYFCRHKFLALTQEVENLKNRNLIAYHFSDEFYEKFNDYKKVDRRYKKGFKQAFNAFKSIEENGSLIVLEYDSPNWFIIAEIPSGQKTQPYTFIFEGKKTIYKTISYKNPKKYYYADYPVLAALRPPYSTICCPQEIYQKIVRAIYYKESLEPNVKLLHPQMLEQLCENFLRSNFTDKKIRLAYAITKSGKTLHTVDIVGRSFESKKILAQVTFHKGEEATKKAESLAGFKTPGSIAIMFSSDIDKNKGVDYHFNIDKIFNQLLTSDNPLDRKMVYELVGLTNLKDIS